MDQILDSSEDVQTIADYPKSHDLVSISGKISFGVEEGSSHVGPLDEFYTYPRYVTQEEVPLQMIIASFERLQVTIRDVSSNLRAFINPTPSGKVSFPFLMPPTESFEALRIDDTEEREEFASLIGIDIPEKRPEALEELEEVFDDIKDFQEEG